MQWNDYKKDYVVWLHNVRTGLFYDISKAVNNINIITNVDGTPGKMTLDIIDYDNIPIEKGSTVSIDYGQWSGTNGTHIYFGFIFSVKYSSNDIHKTSVICYDQARYLKNTYTMLVENQTAEQVVHTLCDYFKIPHYIKDDTKNFIIPKRQFTNETSMNIIKYCIDAIQAYTGERYLLRDEFGWLYFENRRSLGKNYWLKVGETIKSFEYETEIDSNTYNVVEAIWGKMGNTTNEIAHKIVYEDGTSMLLLGVLKKSDIIDNYFESEAQIKQINDLMGQAYSAGMIKLNLDCIGLPELKAGDTINITLPIGSPKDIEVGLTKAYKGDVDLTVYITECTHTITNGMDSTKLVVTPWFYEDLQAKFEDTGVGALKDMNEEKRKKEDAMREALGLTRVV